MILNLLKIVALLAYIVILVILSGSIWLGLLVAGIPNMVIVVLFTVIIASFYLID